MTAPFLTMPEWGLYLAFNADPNDSVTVPTWIEFTKYVKSMSSLSRGANYELDTALAAEPGVLLRDVDEYLNSANASSPYAPNVAPWRRALFMGTWPQATGNLLNAGAWHGNNQSAVDPTFDSYAAGTTLPWWVAAAGAATVTIDTTTPRSGANCVLASWAAVVAGQGASFTVRTMPARQYTVSAYVRLASANTAAISVVGGVTGTSTSTTGAYVRLAVTFTATQPLTVIAVATTGATAAGSLRVDDVQLERGATANTFTTTGPVIYPVMAPYAERFSKVYADGGFTGYVNVPCVDALAALSNTSIGTDFVNTAGIQYTPDHWWPLAGGDLTSAYLPGPSNKATPPLATLISKNGLSTGSLPSPGTPTNIPGDAGGTGVTFTPPDPPQPLVQFAGGAILATSSPMAFPAVTGTTGYSATIAVWVIVTKLVSIESPMLVFPVPASGTTTQPPSLSINTVTGQIWASVGGTLDGAFPPLFFSTDGPSVADGQPHLLVMTVVQDVTNTALRCYVDGVQVLAGLSAGTASIGGVLTSATTGRNIQLGGFFAFGGFKDHLTGVLAHAMLWDSGLTFPQITDLWHAGQGYAGILAGNRVAQHVVTYGRYAGLTRISHGSSVMEAPSYAGTIDEMTDTNGSVDAELGRVWAAPDGALVFEGRNDRFLRLTSLYTLGQNTAGGMLPYEEDVEFDTDPTYILVNVRYTRSGGATGTGGSPADVAAAGLRWFYPPWNKTVDVYADSQAQDLANWVFYTHNGPVQRVAQIHFRPSANPSLWPFCLSVEIGQRITVSMTAPAANGGAGLTWSADYFVENVTHDNIDADTGQWDTYLWCSPIGLGTPQSQQPWILEHATYGQLDFTTKLAP